MPSLTHRAPEKGANGRPAQVPPAVSGRTRDRSNVDVSRKGGPTHKAARETAGLEGYRLGDCLGKGAFGSVYRALNVGTGETVAIKQIKLADLPKSELRVIMLEIDLLKNLNHPNIVKYQGFVKSTDSLYIILEYCENGSLHSICKNFGKFPENLVGLYMAQMLNGLIYLHEQGVIHRDIKGANILTTKEGLVKLADFGVATRTTGLHESSVVGTPYWMAPEVIELSGATTASDIWSLGCTVIELLDGKPPYYKLQPMPALFRIVNDDHPPLPESASPAVRDFLMQCFQKDPNLRVSARKLLKHPWVTNARRSDSVVPTQVETVQRVQEWNEALKSTHASALPKASAPATGGNPSRKRRDPRVGGATRAPVNGAVKLGKQRTNAQAFRSPETTTDTVWDDDFASSIPTRALNLPHLKTHDNLGSILSADKLKAFAQVDNATDDEDWNNNFEGDLTVKSPLQLKEADPLQTIRPYFPKQADAEEIRTSAPTRSPERKSGKTSKMPPPPSSKQGLQAAVPLSKRPAMTYRESSVEDYSDLIPPSDETFDRKLEGLKVSRDWAYYEVALTDIVRQKENSLSPKLFDPSDLRSQRRAVPSAAVTGSVRHPRSASMESNEIPIRRTRSSVEIQRYAEDEGDEDFSDIFGQQIHHAEKVPSDSGSDHGTLMLNSKLSNNSWLGDEDDEDDPFAQLDDGFDEMDLQANIARDMYARLCTQVESLVSSLKTSQSDDTLAELSERLMDVLSESPDTKDVIISAHGMLPILEILDTCTRRDVVLRLLKVVNAIMFDNVEIQENLCFVGGIPIISKFASKRHSSEIRLEAAAFVRQMYQTSTLTLQMFVSCGGLNVLVEFLEEDYEAEKDLVLIGVNGVWSVFELQGPTPKNDLCRIFSRSSVLYPLSLVLNRVLDEEGELAELFQGRIVNIFFLFSQAENHVKELVADRLVLKRVLKDLKRMSPTHQITMLKFIKNLSMLSTTLDSLQNSNAIDVLTDLLSSSMKEPHFREISNQVLNTMYNLCRLSRTRQEDAALNGIIPLLQRIVKTERPLKEFALPILCDMAHSGKVGRKILWQNKGLQFYMSLLSDPYWQVTALDAIFVWLQEETAKVEETLLDGGFTDAIVRCFTTSKANAFENLLEPLQKMIGLSLPIAQCLGRQDLFSRILQKLRHNKAVVRLNLLRIVRTICDSSRDHAGLLRRHGLFRAIQELAESDPSAMVQDLARKLVKTSSDLGLEPDGAGAGDTRRSALRRASANANPPPPPTFHTDSPKPPLQQSHSSTSSSTTTATTTTTSIYESRDKRPPPNGINGARTTSRDGGGGGGGGSGGPSLVAPPPPASLTNVVARSRLPRHSMNRSRSSISAASAAVPLAADKSDGPAAAGVAKTPSYAVLNSRRRRLGSGELR
ncbi:MAG: hypothetical protein M1833_004878 [Piccolia ochrophora]|nr:MAG: hypothetical protein M1833_004878 [Piccolia ochrophora]